jgi:hypothetical protein
MAEESRGFASAEEFSAWLEANHAIEDEVWIPLSQRGTAARPEARARPVTSVDGREPRIHKRIRGS